MKAIRWATPDETCSAGKCSHVMHLPFSDERRLLLDCLVVKSNHPRLERLGF
jgi:hypothetical protein